MATGMPAAGDGGLREAWSVSAFVRALRQQVEEEFPPTWIVGEISNLSIPRSGHHYFVLKDGAAQLPAVLFAHQARRLRFRPADGMEVFAHGTPTVYEPYGRLQLRVEALEPKGVGALERAFRELQERLEKEGLFDGVRKRRLPRFPSRVAIVTSPTGAAIQDMLAVFRRKFPQLEIWIAPVRVQGDGAAREIADAVAELNRREGIDVIVVGRGGGSLEDLWAFNEEVVARAIFASRIPVVSAVGHEVDVSISDLVADVRALTPTAAADLVAPDGEQLWEALADSARRLPGLLRRQVQRLRDRLDGLARHYALRRPQEWVLRYAQRLDDLSVRAGVATRRSVEVWRARAGEGAARLESLSPLGVLSRGYSVTLREDGKTLRSMRDVTPGDRIRTRLAEGEVTSRVEGAE